MSEGRSTGDVANRIDAGGIRRQSIVDRNVALFVRGDTGLVEREAIGVGSAANCRQQMRTGEHALAVRALDGEVDATIRLRSDRPRLGSEQDGNAILAQDAGD